MRKVFAAVLLAGLASTALSQTDVLDLQAVPETFGAARQLVHSSEPVGAYGGYGYGHNEVQGYGYYGRSLVEQDGIILESSDPVLEYAEQQQARADNQQMAAQQAAGDVSAAAVAALKQVRASSSRRGGQVLTVPAGHCYCRFDMDFNTWALGQDACKEALYSRCQSHDDLPCHWLDKFYTPANGPGHVLPYEAEIKSFLFEDCTSQPPCACAGLGFDGTEPVPEAVACCKDLRVACKTPFSGVTCSKVEAFCSDDKPTPVLAAWSHHVLSHSDCSNYTGMPYHFVSLRDLQAAAAGSRQPEQQPAAAEAILLGEMMRSMEHQQQQQHAPTVKGSSSRQQQHLIIALAAVAAGAVCVAVVAVVLAVRREVASAEPITSPPAPNLSTAEVYQALLKNKALTAPQPAACIGPGMPLGLYRDGSADSCLSRVISIGTQLSSQGSGVREPLLQHQSLDRSISNGSEGYSTNSVIDDTIP